MEHTHSVINFLEEYSSGAKRLTALVNNSQISYDLLWALYGANDILFMHCPGSEEPQLQLESAMLYSFVSPMRFYVFHSRNMHSANQSGVPELEELLRFVIEYYINTTSQLSHF